MRSLLPVSLAAGVLLGTACSPDPETEKPVTKTPTTTTTAAPAARFDAIPRLEFNRRAAELAMPFFWIRDDNANKTLEPAEFAVLWGVSDQSRASFVDDKGAFTEMFRLAYAAMQKPAPIAATELPAEKARRESVLAELAQGRPTLVLTTLTTPEDKAVVAHVAKAARLIEKLYARQTGVDGLGSKIPELDLASQMLFFRNQGPFCEAPKTEKDPACSALADKPTKISGIYPASIQADAKFCEVLEKRKDSEQLLSPFVVVQHKPGGKAEGNAATDDLIAVPYTEVYAKEMGEIATELKAASSSITDPGEAAFKAYLDATAAAFGDNQWFKADVAWKAMTAVNSKWYLRIGPDEVYFEPCSHKAGFHVSFARINQDSLQWQKKLDPLKQDMEVALGTMAGKPYKIRDVGFQLPDFIDIVLNAGDARSAIGATIGQSLPNWGPVAESGGKTVAMVNLYTDDDSKAAYQEQASSLLCTETMNRVKDDPKNANLSTVLHEAAHNLGPAHEYKVNGKTDDQVFGGALASMMEELKSQTAALYFSEWLVGKGQLDAAVAENAHIHDVTWAFGHISQGMKNAEGKPKPYSQLAAVQMGFLNDKGALVWRPEAKAANGNDVGCFDLDLTKWTPAVDELTKLVAGIKARGDKPLAEKTRDAFVEEGTPWAKLRGVIADRWLRAPKASFVYSVVDG
ncbi:MAG: hypothetical protein Q8O67_26150 [Deltaproteobacteria bacterium]|nr:hypothetical protein [Deltaproteobacteria bacterium]